jgi:hypothetical protein
MRDSHARTGAQFDLRAEYTLNDVHTLQCIVLISYGVILQTMRIMLLTHNHIYVPVYTQCNAAGW